MRTVLFLAILGSFAMAGQVFEVVSVKPAPDGTRKTLKRAGRLREHIDDAQVDLAGQPMAYLIEKAYGVSEDRLTGPDWIEDARFDVKAKLPAGASKEQVPAMLQAMLADRFQLKIHHEPKTVAAYALTVSNVPPGLKKAAGDPRITGCFDAQGAPGHHICAAMTMAQLAEYLTFTARMAAETWGLDRPVFDATGLSGMWDFTMDYGLVSDSGGETETLRIATAVKALGLKLEPAKHTFDHVVVDHVERTPTDN